MLFGKRECFCRMRRVDFLVIRASLTTMDVRALLVLPRSSFKTLNCVTATRQRQIDAIVSG